MLQAILQFFYWLLALIGLGQQQVEKPEVQIEEEEEEEPRRPQATGRNVRRPRGAAAAAMRRRKAPSASNEEHHDHDESSSDDDNSDGSDHDDDEEGEENSHLAHVKLTRNDRVNLKKMEKKRKKQAMKEQREAMIQAEKERTSQQKKKLEEMEIDREEKELELREREKAERLELEKKKQEEYEEWRHMFEVEDQGEGIDSDLSHNQGLLTEFINYIKDHKVVVLEELASEFKIKTEHCINRIRSLEEEGKITGLLDDRGKFIYISKEEMEKVKQHILQEGRISISELRHASNQLINLKPKEVDVNIEEIL